MSDYRRLVSYIYSYPGGTRDKNVGFAKAEVRNGQFKLNISLKGVYTDTPESFGVHLLVDQAAQPKGRFTLLHVGNILVSGGAGQYADLLNPENINKTGYAFDDVCGIAVARQDNRYYMMFSLWQDTEIHPDLVLFAPKDSKKLETYTGEPPAEEEKLQGPEADNRRTPQPAPGGQQGEQPKDQRGGQQGEQPKVQPERQQEAQIEGQTEEQGEETKTEEAKQEQKEAKEEPIEAGRGQKEINRGQINRESGEESRKSGVRVSAASVQEASLQQKPPIQDDGIGQIFENANFINAFDDDYYFDCIEVTPNQLQKLPIEDKAVINNSFLEHGYYNFRHLLFGRVQPNERHTSYFIGVPGMYCNRERFMATMFGFNNFKKSHRADYNNPYFGYWYQEI